MLDSETIDQLTSLLESKKKKLTSLSIQNLGLIYAPGIKPSQNVQLSNLPNCFRRFCAQLRKDKHSKIETLELLGEMATLNFIKGIILEVRQSNCTALK